jgi:hypothetical protein
VMDATTALRRRLREIGQREMKFREEQGALPSETWERERARRRKKA